MNPTTGKRVVSGIVALFFATVALTGCAPSNESVPAGDYPDFTLAETKSSTQILRNTAIGRVSRVLINNVDAQTDTSLACLTESDDPRGRIRQWESTVDIALEPWKAQNADEIAAELVASFVKEGWSETTAEERVVLVNDDSAVQLAVSASTSEGTISVEVTGPCVVSDGAGSDEVAALG